MYIETSNPRKPNDAARLISPLVPANSGSKCLTFWYHMYGASVNNLNVYAPSGVRMGNPIWTRHGTQGNQWKKAQILITKTLQFTVLL